MNHRRLTLLCHLLFIGIVLVHSAEARGQDVPFKKEAFAKIGYGNTAEDEGSLGSGMVLGGGVGFQITQRWEMAFEIHLQENKLFRGAGGFFSDGHSLSFGGSALYHFSQSQVQPYLLVGLHFARFDGAKGFEPENPSSSDHPPDSGWRQEGAQSFLGPEFGAGLKIFVADNISLRPEFRLFAGGSGGYDPATDVVEPGLFLATATIGIGYHW